MFISEIDNKRGLKDWNRRNEDFRLCHGITFITDESNNNKQEYFTLPPQKEAFPFPAA
jgi:hypothetical protein